MEPRINLNLLFISLFLVLSINSARSARLAPAPQPASSPSQSPSQAPDSSQENIDLYPLAPSASEADSDDDSSSDGTATLDIKKDDSSTATLDKKEDDSSTATLDKKEDDSSTATLDVKEDDSSSDSDSDSSSDVKKNATIDFAADLHAIEVSPELKKICDQTDHSTLCLATVLPLVKEGDKASVDSVLQVAVEAGSAFAKEALSEAKKLAEKPGTSEDLKATLKDCEDGYNTAIDNFQKTLDAYSSSDLGTMRTMLSAVISFVGDCQDQFTEMQIESPLTSYSEKLTEMASNCLAISSLEKTN